MKYSIYIFAIAAFMIMTGCKGAKSVIKVPETAAAPTPDFQMKAEPIGGYSQAMPKAVIYKTNGDYDNNVTVTLAPDGKSLVSFPAPTDVNANSAPIAYKDGWLLDRRGGICKNTAFLSYTYEEYAKLPATPSIQDLMDHILPDAKVIETRVLPIYLYQALEDPSKVMDYIEK